MSAVTELKIEVTAEARNVKSELERLVREYHTAWQRIAQDATKFGAEIAAAQRRLTEQFKNTGKIAGARDLLGVTAHELYHDFYRNINMIKI